MTERVLARAIIASTLLLGAIGAGSQDAEAARPASRAKPAKAEAARLSDRECMARAMYFESNRNRADGMLAVGTIVANRLASGRYAGTVCGVVGQSAQFAPGVLVRPMVEARPAARARRVADAVLAGARHPTAGDAMFFHTANVPFRHDDKAYVLVSGGNAFYRWNRPIDTDEARENAKTLTRAVAATEATREVGEREVDEAMVAASTVPVETPAPVAAPAPVATAAPEIATAELATPAPDAAAPAQPELVAARDALIAEPKVAQEIVDAPNPLSQALAFRGEPARTPAANAALAAVMALAPREARAKDRTPRIVAPAAPVYASSAPIFRAKDEPRLNPMANFAVAQAWSGFD